MLRRTTILLTLLSLIVAGMGLPASLHACSMEGMSVGSGCGMCSAKLDRPAPEPCGPSIRKAPCCTTTKVSQQMAPSLLRVADLPLPVALSPIDLQIDPYAAIFDPLLELRHGIDSSPPHPGGGTTTWLFVSSLLI